MPINRGLIGATVACTRPLCAIYLTLSNMRYASLVLILCLFFSCVNPKESIYANENYYFDLDTLRASELYINGISLDNTEDQILKLGKSQFTETFDELSKKQFGDSSRKSQSMWVNEFNQSDTSLFIVRTNSIYIGENLELRFTRRSSYYSLEYGNFLSSNLTIESNVGVLSRKTRFKDIIEKFPRSKNWINDSSYPPAQYILDLSEHDIDLLDKMRLNWIPLSDGNRGTIHLLFGNGKLVYLKRLYSEI